MGRRTAGRAGGLVLIAGVLAALVLGNVLGRRPQPPSSYSAAPGGLEALYRLLRGEGVAVGRRTGAALPTGGILVCAAGARPLSGAEAARLVAWVRAGHEAVVFGADPSLAAALYVEILPWPPLGGEAWPAVALPELRGAAPVAMPSGVVLVSRSGGVLLVDEFGRPAGLDLRVGRGRVYWFGSAGIWSNATLAHVSGNLALAEDLLGGGRPVWFDEYWFGRALVAARPAPAGRPGPRLPLPPGWEVAAAALAASAGAALWSAGWRRHPVRPEPEPVPGAVEPVLAYAELLFRSGGKGESDA